MSTGIEAGPGAGDGGDVAGSVPGVGDVTVGDVTVGDVTVGDVTVGGDQLPPELDVTGYVGPYVFPNNSRRRVPGALYAFIGVVAIATWALTLAGDPNIVNGGFLAGGIALLVLSAYHFRAGWDLRVEETDALLEAVRAVGFPVGHASAQMGWRGWFSRPTWRILVFSNEIRPLRRGLVLVDGVEREVLEVIVEDNPEDWSELADGDIYGPSD